MLSKDYYQEKTIILEYHFKMWFNIIGVHLKYRTFDFNSIINYLRWGNGAFNLKYWLYSHLVTIVLNMFFGNKKKVFWHFDVEIQSSKQSKWYKIWGFNGHPLSSMWPSPIIAMCYNFHVALAKRFLSPKMILLYILL